ncbi:hypothetical protein IVA95_16185 [Bradyrhizobium sp. 157]|uniref:hypothetical protein n=1 Tax=Bradyrhizobium sp. 157 TaxID=2782631 RepID=UPI001FF84A45|nr:hypothetical protein [Bradyrhizobium sp. 157]MCK1639100.1 hypothetical protein [Bradyrhizobium sp. 157]
MSRQLGLREAITKLAELGPLVIEVIDPTVRPSPEEDPDNVALFARAADRFIDEIKGDHRPRCMLCRSVRWLADIERNSTRPAALAIVAVAPEFRCDADDDPAFHVVGICAACTKDPTTLRERVLNALRTLFPNMQAFRASEVPNMPPRRT